MLAREYPGIGWLGLCDIDETDAARGSPTTPGGLRHHRSRASCSRGPRSAPSSSQPTSRSTSTRSCARSSSACRCSSRSRWRPTRSSPPGCSRRSQEPSVDAVVGYTQRFRRRFQTVKQRLRDGQIGDVTTVVTRAFMNRMVPEATLRKVADPTGLTPMVVSGTHSLDMCMWLLEGRAPVEVYARSTDRTLGPHRYQGRHVGHLHDGRRRGVQHEHQLGAADRVARRGLRPGDRHRRHTRASSTSKTPTATSSSPRRSASRPAIRAAGSSRLRRGTSTSSAAIPPATSRTACCGGRCARRPRPGSPGCAAASKHRTPQRPTATPTCSTRWRWTFRPARVEPVPLPISPDELITGLGS